MVPFQSVSQELIALQSLQVFEELAEGTVSVHSLNRHAFELGGKLQVQKAQHMTLLNKEEDIKMHGWEAGKRNERKHKTKL